jgi:hypothetical protein
MPTHKKNTLLQAAQGNAETKACKRVFFSATQENFFPTLPFLMNLFSPTHGLTRNPTVTVFNINRYLDRFVQTLDNNLHRTDRRASGNSGFKKLAVQWLNQVQFFNQTFVQVDSFVLRNRQLLKPAKRYVQP